MRPEAQAHLDAAIEQVKQLFTEAAQQIDNIEPGARKPGTKIAEELAEQRGLKGLAFYPVLKAFLFDSFPGIRMDKGSKGGCYRLTKEDIEKALKQAEHQANAEANK